MRAAVDTDLVTPATARALRARMLPPAGEGVFDAAGRTVLVAACDRLLPQADRSAPIDLAGIVEDRLASGVGDGWRHDVLPCDAVAMQRGVAAIDATAHARHGLGFAQLDMLSRDAVLAAVQRGDVEAQAWAGLDPRRFFEELLVAVTEAYYAHPIAQEEIGYLGMADAKGWTEVGLGARAPHEPEPL